MGMETNLLPTAMIIKVSSGKDCVMDMVHTDTKLTIYSKDMLACGQTMNGMVMVNLF